MASALAAAAEIVGTIDSGARFGDARFRFADEVSVQLLPPLDDVEWVERLRDTAMALATSRSAQRAAQSYLEARPDGTFVAQAGLAVLPSDVVNAADRWPVAE